MLHCSALLITCLFLFLLSPLFSSLFFFNAPATTEIYTLSLHDALPISSRIIRTQPVARHLTQSPSACRDIDRKSTRLNSSHRCISYAVFCLKKKKKTNVHRTSNSICTSNETFLR